MARASSAIKKNASRNIPTRPLAHSKVGAAVSLRDRPFWRLMLGILLFGLAVTVVVSIAAEGDLMRELPLSLHSSIKASYAADPINSAIQPFKMELIGDALDDHAGDGGNAPVVQLATVISDLLTPVPSITPLGTLIPKHTPTNTNPGVSSPTVPTATDTTAPLPSETPTLVEPTMTLDPGKTATWAPSPTRKSTTPPRATATVEVVQRTFTPTTSIQSPPTVTPTPLPTRTLPPTATQAVPPTIAPTLPPPPTQPPAATPTTAPYPQPPYP